MCSLQSLRSLRLIVNRSWRRECTPVGLLTDICSFSTKSTSKNDFSSPSSTNTSGSSGTDSLYRRIIRIGDRTASITPVLDQWREQGRRLTIHSLFLIIKQLRNYRHYNHALQISEWMEEKLNFTLLPRDIAVRLDLIAKVQGLEQAERYFDTVSEDRRNRYVYGTLLHCYSQAQSLEKAEAVMQKLRDMGFGQCNLPSNDMLILYSQLGKLDKLDGILQEMEDKGIPYSDHTYNIRLNAYITASDIEGMEKFLSKIQSKPQANVSWNAYTVAAHGYQKAGLIEKAAEMLGKAEKRVDGENKRSAYDHMISLYAAMGEKDDVHRVWNLIKSLGRVYNVSYRCMVSALLKLDDMDGAEKLVEEWESGKHKWFDCRIPNALISAYCKKGLVDKAESYVNRLIEAGKKPTPNTWDRLATGYCQADQMEKAVEAMRKAFLGSHPKYKPNAVAVTSCLKFLKEKDSEKVEEFVKLFRERCTIPNGVDVGLLNDVGNDEPEAEVLERQWLEVGPREFFMVEISAFFFFFFLMSCH